MVKRCLEPHSSVYSLVYSVERGTQSLESLEIGWTAQRRYLEARVNPKQHATRSTRLLQMPAHNAVKPHALPLPGINKMKNKRVILASNSPRRLDILKTYVSSLSSRCI
jgi:hypothetical protein